MGIRLLALIPRKCFNLERNGTLLIAHCRPNLIFDGSSRLGTWKPGSLGAPGYWEGVIKGISGSFKTFADGMARSQAQRQTRPRRKRKGPPKASGGTPRGLHSSTKWGYYLGVGETVRTASFMQLNMLLMLLQGPTSTAQLNTKEGQLWKDFLACPFFKATTNCLMGKRFVWSHH